MERTKKPRKDTPRLIKFDQAEVAKIQELANQHANGNFSRWVREAAVQYQRSKARHNSEGSILKSLGMVD